MYLQHHTTFGHQLCLHFHKNSARLVRRVPFIQRQAATVEVDVPASAPQTKDQQHSTAQHRDTSRPAPEAALGGELFNWTHAWYPIAAVTALQKDAPNAQQLLGQRLVVWWDKASSNWRCFEDLCPHRLAPLSEGRLHESGQLQCTYHGWLFDSSGSCTSIPQLGDSKAHATACSSSRSCVKSYPTFESQGLLWVYAGGEDGSSSAAPGLQPPPELLPPPGCELKSPWFQRDVPLSYDILLENFTDPAHVPHSHHGVVGDRNASHVMHIEPQGPVSNDGGFSMTVHSPARLGMNSYKLHFKPPCLVRHDFPGVTMLLYGVPQAVGHSRIVMTFVAPPEVSATRPPTPQLPGWLNMMLDLIDRLPAVLHAVNRNAIVDGDAYFLHAAGRTLYERGDATSWRRQYYMPGSSDAAVLGWRKWLDTFGAALPTLPRSAADLPPLLPREQVLDRFNQHTKICPHCSAALRFTNIAAAIMAAVAAVAAGSIIAAVVGGSAPLLSQFNAGAAAVAAVAAAVTAALVRFRQVWIYTDYVHAEH